jgi:hypothetical protein
MSTPRLRTIPATRRGRPRKTNTLAAELIGSAGVAALESADLYVVTGDILRELALVVGEAAPEKPTETPNAEPPAQTA